MCVRNVHQIKLDTREVTGSSHNSFCSSSESGAPLINYNYQYKTYAVQYILYSTIKINKECKTKYMQTLKISFISGGIK